MFLRNSVAIALSAISLWPSSCLGMPAIVSTVTVSACKASYSTTALVASTTTTSDAQPTILTPVSGDGDPSQHSNLVPNNTAQMSYAQIEVNLANGSSVAVVSIDDMDYPAVNLLQTSFISTLTCTNNTASVTFNNEAAYQVATGNWSSSLPFVMITYHEECGDAYANGEHGFVIADNITSTSPGSLTIDLSITHTDFGTAVGADTNVTVSLGSYSPNGDGSFSSNGNPSTTPVNSTASNGLNSTYDDNLDDSLGPYISISNESTWGQLFPGNVVNSSDSTTGQVTEGEDYPTLDDRKRSIRNDHNYRKRSLEPRGFFDFDWFTEPFESVGEAMVSVGNTIGDGIVKAAETVAGVAVDVGQTVYKAGASAVNWVGNAVDDVESAALKALDVLDRFLSVDKSLSETVSMDEYPSNADSPWGRAYSLYNSDTLKAYCVGCGVNGRITITGRLIFSVASGLKEGSIGADGNFHGVMELGFVANGLQKEIPIANTTIASLSLSDLVLPGIIQLGPTISLGAGASLILSASGNLVAGAILDWPAIHAKLDVVSLSDAEASGFAPDVTPIFSVDGSISAAIDVHLTASLGFTIGLLNIDKFTTSVALVDQPGLRATATVTGSASVSDGSISGQFGSCAGVEFSANVYNKVYADLFGSQKDIFEWTSPSLSHCVKVSKKRSVASVASVARRRATLEMPKTATRRHFGQKSKSRVSANTTTTHALYTNTSQAEGDNEDDNGASDNATYSVISTQDELFALHWSTNGNVYVISANDTTDSVETTDSDSDYDSEDITTDFATFASAFILGDADGRALHGYADELAAHGVTRVRLHDVDEMPATSVMLAIRAVADANGGSDIMAAEDTAGNLYAPIVCAYEQSYPKLFFANNPNISPPFVGSWEDITGEGVTSCGYIPFEVSF